MKKLLNVSIILFLLLCYKAYCQSIQDFQNHFDQISSLKNICQQGICQDNRISQASSLYTSLKTSGLCFNDLNQQRLTPCIGLLNNLSFYYPETHLLTHLLKLIELTANQLNSNQKVVLSTQIRLREFPYVFANRDFPYIKNRAVLNNAERGILLSQQLPDSKNQQLENAFLLAKDFRLPKVGGFIVVVSSPLCGPSIRFREWLDDHPALLSVFEKQAIWITPIEDRLYFPEFVQYNQSHPTTAIHYIHQFLDWQEIQLWSTPVLYFFKNGELIAQKIGFQPQDKPLLVSELTNLGLISRFVEH